ncbi:MAG: aminoacetone oxidase family FAD-binding enzyme [Acidobacteria bacterium]|nr:aminoacetone oxidase family FAD-binding enzyme [Acidobacteriota bacterium]
MSGSEPARDAVDLVVVGAGAAGLATAIFAARAASGLRMVCLDGARHIGAKILVSGGSRCNVTNRRVTERDFWGGSSRAVRNVLRAFSAEDAAIFFNDLGVALHEEEGGKLFPDTNRSRTVLDALLRELRRLGVELRSGERVTDVDRGPDGLAVVTPHARYRTRCVVLATGGRSLPKSGSDGNGYELAARLGHGYVDTTPALAPLVLAGGRHAALSGVSHDVRLTVRVAGGATIHLDGALLWTHFGASGPVVLNASRHWHRARLDGRAVDVLVNLFPGDTFESLEAWFGAQALARPRAHVATVLATRLPAAVATTWTREAGLAEQPLAHLTRQSRRSLIHALLSSSLDVRDSRGYTVAEATAGGIPLDDVDPSTMASRSCDGVYLVGEMLDVDGRLGGFNFQWAWSSAWVAGHAIARALNGVARRAAGDVAPADAGATGRSAAGE